MVTPICSTPIIAYSDGRLVFSSDTDGAWYHYTIANDDVVSSAYSKTGELDFGGTFAISVFASADGHINSETATATLCFVDGTFVTEGIAITYDRRGIVLAQSGQDITVSGLESGEIVSLYSISGRR